MSGQYVFGKVARSALVEWLDKRGDRPEFFFQTQSVAKEAALPWALVVAALLHLLKSQKGFAKQDAIIGAIRESEELKPLLGLGETQLKLVFGAANAALKNAKTKS